MSEGNLLDQHHHRQPQANKLFSSRDSELELLDTTTPTTSSPEIRSRSQSVGSAHREALLFFEQHRLFQNSPDRDFVKENLFDCELRSISSCSRNSSPANRFIDQTTSSNNGVTQHRQHLQKSHLCHHQQQVSQASGLRQQSDSNLLESSTAANNEPGRTSYFDRNSGSTSSPGRARSQSQGQCGSVRRKQDCGNVIVVNTTNNKRSKGGESSRSGVIGKTSKWLEEIQFTAQYQHYRTNNYASVVSSASSLDKSDGGTSTTLAGGGGPNTASASSEQPPNIAGQLTSLTENKQKDASEAESQSKSSSRPPSSSTSQQYHHHQQRHRHHSQFAKGSNNQEGEAGAAADFRQHPQHQFTNPDDDDPNRTNPITPSSHFWNFPRVKLKKLFTAKSLDDILGGRSGRSKGRKDLRVSVSSATRDEISESDQRSTEIVGRTVHTKKAQLLRDNKLTLPRSRQGDDKTHLLLVKPVHERSKSPGAHSSKSAIVISSSSGGPSKQRKAPSFIKATRQKSRSFSALTSVLLSRVPGHSSSSANSPCSSTASSSAATGLSVFFTKRSHQPDKNVPPVIPPKKSGRVPCAKSDNCLNRIVASATCGKFVDYFGETSARVSKSATSTTTLVEHIVGQEHFPPGTPSSSSATGGQNTSLAGVVVTAQPRKWTAIKNKWDQKLQSSGDRQKEIGASLASVSNNAQIFRKAHHQHHQQRQRSSSLSPLDNPDDGKSIESLLEITSPSPTLQEVRFLDTPEIRYASPIAVRSSRGEFNNFDDDDDFNEDESETLKESVQSCLKLSRETIATTTCSSDTESYCSDCRDTNEEEEDEMTRHHSTAAGSGVGTKRSRDHHHRHSRHHHHHGAGSTSKEKPKLVVANVSYLQRPMSPGLVLRDASPSSSAVSGTVDPFGNLIKERDDTGGNLSSSVIRNNNVFTNNSNNNQLYQQSKSQQAKLEFLKSFPHAQPHQTKRDPLSSVNVNEGIKPVGTGFSGAFSMSISPSSSGGASDKDNYGSNNSSKGSGVGACTIGHGNVQGTMMMSRHQTDDLQDRFNRQRTGQFADVSLRSATGDPLVMMGMPKGSISGCGVSFTTTPKNQTKGVSEESKGVRGDDDSHNFGRCYSPPPRDGAELCGFGNQSFEIGFADQHQGAISGSGRVVHGASTDCGTRSTDSQSSGRDPDTDSGKPGGNSAALSSIDTTFSINQGSGTGARTQSTIVNNNNLLIDVDFEDAEDTMGDLQSPQYVKRTAHMFDSRFSSEHGTNGHDRNGRNPSYLNVSKSVSGYSCLTYNNGSVSSETVSNKSATAFGNGASLLTGTRVSPATPRLKTDYALHSPFSRKVPQTDEDSDHSSSQSATSPPPSLPPINTTSTGRFSDSSFYPNGMNRGEDLLEDTPYIPSHGKSFIMQRIERLYGSDAVSNKGVLTRKSSHVTTISITRESPQHGKERIIPIKVEPREDDHNNLYNYGVITKKHEISKEDSTGFSTVVLPEIKGIEGNGRRVQHRYSQGSVEETDEDEDGIRARSPASPNKLQSSNASFDNSGHLNGNANLYGNEAVLGYRMNDSGLSEDRISSSMTRPTAGNEKLEQIIHTNGNHHEIVDGQDCSMMKKALSRESSAESDETNECSENSLEFGISDVDSKTSASRKDSNSSLYSNRGTTSPIKPKPKPKPKDMALLRTLSRSPALKSGTENFEKTAISLSIVQPEADTTECITEPAVDQIDADISSALSDIKNTISTPTKCISENKSSHPDKENCVTIENNTPDSVGENQNAEESSDIKDGNYFIRQMSKVTKDFANLSENAAKELETLDPADDRAGSIHAAIGKGNLLVKKKFKQFEELCQANLKGADAEGPVTTNEDLAGFWDMVMIQVDQVYALFADLANNEQKAETVLSGPTKTPSPKRQPASTTKSTRPSVGTTPKVNPAAAKARDEARRKLLAEKRKAMKSQMQEAQEITPEGPEGEVQIFAPETPHTG